MPSIQTRRNVGIWEHPNTILSFDEISNPGNLVEIEGQVSVAPNEHILLLATFRPKSSGWQITDHYNPSGTGPIGENEFSYGPHKQGLFNGNGGGSVVAGYGSIPSHSFEARAYCVYIDREITEKQYIVEAVVDYSDAAKQSDYIPQFNQIREDSLVGTDDGFGTYSFTKIAFVNMAEVGYLRLIKWDAGKAPPLTTMKNAIMFTWFEWCNYKRFRLYDSIRGFS